MNASSLTEEQLREHLGSLYRQKETAESAQRESELLLRGLNTILERTTPEEMFGGMFEILGEIIEFDTALVLEPHGHEMACIADTSHRLLDVRFEIDSILQRTLDGKTCSVFSIAKQPAWQPIDETAKEGLLSALYSPIITPDKRAILVLCHGRRGFFSKAHVALLSKFSALTEQTLARVNARLLARETEKLKAQKERAEASLIEAEKLASLGQLSAGIAHEINNPVGFVMSNVEFLRDVYTAFQKQDALIQKLIEQDEQGKLASLKSLREELELDELFDDFKDIIDESHIGLIRIRDIVSGLRTFAREDAGDFRETDINECLQLTVKMVNNELKYHCTVHTEFAEIPLIHASVGKLNQVFTNLLLNAGHAVAGKGNGNIWIRSRRDDEFIVVEVEDDGHGIPADKLRKIFEPFYTSKPSGQGTGLGLAISYSLVQEHQGRIEVDSTVDQGTTFRIFIPALNPTPHRKIA